MKQSTTSTHPLRIPLFTLLLVTYFCASTGLHVAYAAATQGAAGYHDAKTFDSKIIADFTRFQPVFFGPLNSTFLCNSTHLAKNLPRCNGNFWNGDEIGRFTCDSDKKTVLSTMPTRCLEFSKKPNALGVYECVKCPWASNTTYQVPTFFDVSFRLVVTDEPIINPLKFGINITAPVFSNFILPHTVETSVGRGKTVSTRSCSFWVDNTVPQRCAATSMSTDGQFHCQVKDKQQQYSFDRSSEFIFAHCLTWRLTKSNKFQCTTFNDDYLMSPSNNDAILKAKFKGTGGGVPAINWNSTTEIHKWYAYSTDNFITEVKYPIGVISGDLPKNLPACPNNAWFQDPTGNGLTYSCLTNSSIVISSSYCAEYSNKVNAIGIYECIKVPYGIGQGIQSRLYGVIPDQSGQLFNDIGNFTLFNDPILPSKLNPKTDSIQSLLLPLIIQNTTAFPYGIQSLPPPSQLVADLCDEIIYTLENTFVCNDKKAGKKYLFNPADANLVPLNLDPLFAPTISPGSAYELVDGVLYCTLAYGSPL